MAAPHVSAALALLAAQTGLRGAQLEKALFTRALAPHAADFGQVECARSANATPISAGSAHMRAARAGEALLDLGARGADHWRRLRAPSRRPEGVRMDVNALRTWGIAAGAA